MRLLVLMCFAVAVEAGFFDFIFGRQKDHEGVTIHDTAPDPGQLYGTHSTHNLGHEVDIPSSDSHNVANTLSNRVPVRSRTATPGSRVTTVNRALPTAAPSSRVVGGGVCPSRVSAFCEVEKTSYLFSDGNVYVLRDNIIHTVAPVSEIFPSGPHSINAAVYDKEKLWVVLVDGRTVYAYKAVGGSKFVLDSSFPKELPDNVFTPNGAMRWHDTRQMLLSNGGKFALYDEYWNKSLMTARTADYFKGLPDNTRGVSDWRNGEAKIFTKNLVFNYSASTNSTAGDGVPLSTYFRC